MFARTTTFQRIYRFLRPTIFVMVLYSVGLLLLVTVADPPPTNDTSVTYSIGQFSEMLDNITTPNPNLTPTDVIQIQLQGLSNPDVSQGILQCMFMASPANRCANGPLERFGKMVRSESFAPLSSPEKVLVGEPIYVGRHARVLVTLYHQQRISSYVWVLKKQSRPPYENCWMTDAVFPQVDMPLETDDNRPPDDSI